MNNKQAALVTTILEALCALTAIALEYPDPIATSSLFGALFFPSFLIVFLVDVLRDKLKEGDS